MGFFLPLYQLLCNKDLLLSYSRPVHATSRKRQLFLIRPTMVLRHVARSMPTVCVHWLQRKPKQVTDDN